MNILKKTNNINLKERMKKMKTIKNLSIKPLKNIKKSDSIKKDKNKVILKNIIYKINFVLKKKDKNIFSKKKKKKPIINKNITIKSIIQNYIKKDKIKKISLNNYIKKYYTDKNLTVNRTKYKLNLKIKNKSKIFKQFNSIKKKKNLFGSYFKKIK